MPSALEEEAAVAVAICCAKVKDAGTEKLRSALVDACSEKQQAEEEQRVDTQQHENANNPHPAGLSEQEEQGRGHTKGESHRKH